MTGKGKKKNNICRLTGYIVFSREYRQQLMVQNPGLSFGALSRIIGKKWSELDKKQQGRYQRTATKLTKEEEKKKLGKSEISEPRPVEDTPCEVIDLVEEENMSSRKSSRVKKSPVVYQSPDPTTKPTKTSKSVSKATTYRRIIRHDIDLHMECVDDELSQAQIEAIAYAHQEHEKANDLIKEFRAGHILVPSSQPNTFLLATSKISQQLPQQQAQKVAANFSVVTPEPGSSGSLPPPRPAQFLNKQQHPKPQGSICQPDVIVIGENPPLPKVGAPTITNLHTQTLPTVSVQPSSVTPQQVYKFINVPTTMSSTLVQNQWTLRPLLKVSPQQQSGLIAANISMTTTPHLTQIGQGQSSGLQTVALTSHKQFTSPGEDMMALGNLLTLPNTPCHRLGDPSKNVGNSVIIDEKLSSDGQQFEHEIIYKIISCTGCAGESRQRCGVEQRSKIRKDLHHISQVFYCNVIPGSFGRRKRQRLKRCNGKQGYNYIFDSVRRKYRIEYVLHSHQLAILDEILHSRKTDDKVDESSDSARLICDNSENELHVDVNEEVDSVFSSDDPTGDIVELVVSLDETGEGVIEKSDFDGDSHNGDDVVSEIEENVNDNHYNSLHTDRKNVGGNSVIEQSVLEFESESRAKLDDLDLFEHFMDSQMCANSCSISDLKHFVDSFKDENCSATKTKSEKCLYDDFDAPEKFCSSDWRKKRREVFNDFLEVPQIVQQVYVLQLDTPSHDPPMYVSSALKPANKLDATYGRGNNVLSKEQRFDEVNDRQTDTFNSCLACSLSPELNENDGFLGDCHKHKLVADVGDTPINETDDKTLSEGMSTENENVKMKVTKWYENPSKEDIEHMLVLSKEIGLTKTSKRLQVPKTQLLKWKRLLKKTNNFSKFNVAFPNNVENTVDIAEPGHVTTNTSQLTTLYSALNKTLGVCAPDAFHEVIDIEQASDVDRNGVAAECVREYCDEIEIGAQTIIDSNEVMPNIHSRESLLHKNKKCFKNKSVADLVSLKELGEQSTKRSNKMVTQSEEGDDYLRLASRIVSVNSAPERSVSDDLSVVIDMRNNSVMGNKAISVTSSHEIQTDQNYLCIDGDKLNEGFEVDKCRINLEHRYHKMETGSPVIASIDVYENDEVDNSDEFERRETIEEEGLVSLPTGNTCEIEGRVVQIYHPFERKNMLQYLAKQSNVPPGIDGKTEREDYDREENRRKREALVYGIPTCYCSYDSYKLKDTNVVAVCQYCMKLVDLRVLEHHDIFSTEFVKYVLENNFFPRGSIRSSPADLQYEISKVGEYIRRGILQPFCSISNQKGVPQNSDFLRLLLILQSKVGINRVRENFHLPNKTLSYLKMNCRKFVNKLCCLSENVASSRHRRCLDSKLKMKVVAYERAFGMAKVKQFILVTRTTVQSWSKMLVDGDVPVSEFTDEEIDALIRERYLREQDRFELCLAAFGEPLHSKAKNCKSKISKISDDVQVMNEDLNNYRTGHAVHTTYPNGMEILLESDDDYDIDNDAEQCSRSLLDNDDVESNNDRIGKTTDKVIESENESKLVINITDPERSGNDEGWAIDRDKAVDKVNGTSSNEDNDEKDKRSGQMIEVMSWNISNESDHCQDLVSYKCSPKHDRGNVGVENNSMYISNQRHMSEPSGSQSFSLSNVNETGMSDVSESNNIGKTSQDQNTDEHLRLLGNEKIEETRNICRTERMAEESDDKSISAKVKPKLTVDINEVIYISDFEDDETSKDTLLSPSEIKSEPFDEDFDGAKEWQKTQIVDTRNVNESLKLQSSKHLSVNEKSKECSDRFEITQLGMGNENDKTTQGFAVQSNSGNSNSGSGGSRDSASYSNNVAGGVNQNMITDIPRNVQIVGASELIPGEEYILLDPRVLSSRRHPIQTLQQPRLIRPPLRKLSPPALSVSSRAKVPTPVHIVQNVNVRSNINSNSYSPSKPPPLTAYHPVRASLDRNRQGDSNAVNVQQSLLSGSIVYETAFNIHPSVPSSTPYASSLHSHTSTSVSSTISSPIKVMNSIPPVVPLVLVGTDGPSQVTDRKQLVTLHDSDSGSKHSPKKPSQDAATDIATTFQNASPYVPPISSVETRIHSSKDTVKSIDTKGQKVATSEPNSNEAGTFIQKTAVKEPPKQLMKIISDSQEYLEKEKLLLQMIKKQKEAYLAKTVHASVGNVQVDKPNAQIAASIQGSMPTSNRISSLIERMSSRVSGQSKVPNLVIPDKTNFTAKQFNTHDTPEVSRPKTASQILFGSTSSPKKISDSSETSREETSSKDFLNMPSTSGIAGKRDLRKSPITARDIESSEESDDELDDETSDEETASCSSSLPETSDAGSNNSNNSGNEALSAKLKSILNADIFTVIDAEDENVDKSVNVSTQEETTVLAQASQPVKQNTSARLPGKDKLKVLTSQHSGVESEGMKKAVHYSIGIKAKLAKLGTIFSLSSLHRKYGINLGTLSMWKQKYQNEDIKDLQLTQDEVNEIETIRKMKDNLKKGGYIKQGDRKGASSLSDYQIYVDNPEEEVIEDDVEHLDLPGAPGKFKPEERMPACALKAKQPMMKKSVVDSLSVGIDASKEMKSKERDTGNNILTNKSKGSGRVFQESSELGHHPYDTAKPESQETNRNKPQSGQDVTWEKTVYFCATEGVFKYKYEPKKKVTVNKNEEIKGTETSALDSLFNKSLEESASRTDGAADRGTNPSVNACSPGQSLSTSSEIAAILRNVPKTKTKLIMNPSDAEKSADCYPDAFKSKIVSEARRSGFENTAKLYEVSIADIMKWHDSLLDDSKHRNVVDDIVVECVDDSVEDTEPVINELHLQSRGPLGKLNSNLSFEKIQVKEGTIMRPKFNSNPVGKTHPTIAESSVRTVPSNPKPFRTRMGPNSIKFASRTSSDQLNQFQADVQGDLGIMPKFVKHSFSREKKDGVEIASTWKQVQSILNPPKIAEKKYSQEYKNRIIRECEVKGQKTVSLEYKIPYNEISRWRLEAKRSSCPGKPKLGHGINKTDIADSKSSSTVSVKSDLQPVVLSLPEEVMRSGEPESLKIKIKLSSINQPKNSGKKQKSDKRSNSNNSDKKVVEGGRKNASLNDTVQEKTWYVPSISGRKVRDSNVAMVTEETPGPIDEDIDHRMEVINFCFEQGVLKTQKKYNVTRQSIIDLMKEYDELNKYAVDKYNQTQGFKTKLVSREKTSVEVTSSAAKPVIVKNLNDYIVTPEYMQIVVDYAVKHGITAASRKYKRKTNTVRSWINQFQKEEKKKISNEQVAKEQELLAANVSLDEARKISVLEARRKRQLLEAEFRRHIVEFAREFGITAASRRFKKKASTVKSWMGHFAKSERDAKRLEGASKQQKIDTESGNVVKHSSERSSLSVDLSNTTKLNSPPCSPIWEQDFVIKPSSSESPLKLTLSPRRKSVVLIDSSCEEDTMDEETNDIETEDEQESDFVELAAWEYKDTAGNSEKVHDISNSGNKDNLDKKADNLSEGVIDLVSDEEKIEKPKKDQLNPENEIIDISEDPKADGLDELDNIEVVPNNVSKADPICALVHKDVVVNLGESSKVDSFEDIDCANQLGNSVTSGQILSDNKPEEKITEPSIETVVEEIPVVPYKDTLMCKVYTDEIDTFFLNENLSVKFKVKKDNSEKLLYTLSSEDNRSAGAKKFRKYADAEIMQNIDETCLFNETRLTRNTAKPPGIEDTKVGHVGDKDGSALKQANNEVSHIDSVETKTSANKSNSSINQVNQSDRSLFDILADETEISANTTSDSDSKSSSLFGNLMKSFKIPQCSVIDISNEIKTVGGVEEDLASVKNSPEVENKTKDITERNLFDFIVPDTEKEEPIPRAYVSGHVGSSNISEKSASVSSQKSEKSSDLLPKQRKPMFKFPKLASPFNFGNIAKLGMAKIREHKEVDNANSATFNETSNAIIGDQIDTQNKPKEVMKVENSKSEKVNEPHSVVMETFEELRKRLAQERAVMKLLKEKTVDTLVAAKQKDSIEENDSEKHSDGRSISSSEEIDYEMYKDFTPQKIVLILDISKKHGVEFASTSFGLPVPVIVNWVIEKDRKHRKVALSVSLEEKLRILERIKEDNKEKLAKELGHKVTDFDQWERDVGWMIHNKGVCDVLKKWQTVKSVVSLNFEEKTNSIEKSVEKIENTSLSSDPKCAEVVLVSDVKIPVNCKDSLESVVEETLAGTTDTDLSIANQIESPHVTSNVNTIPDILDFLQTAKPRDFTVEQKAIIVLLSDKYGSCTVSKKTGVNQGTLFNWRHKKSSVRQYLCKQSAHTVDERKLPKEKTQHSVTSDSDKQNNARETRRSASLVPANEKQLKEKLIFDKAPEEMNPIRGNAVDSDEETEGRTGYRVISPSKLPSVLKNVTGISGKDYTLEQKVAIVKLVELYGVRTIHKQFRITAGCIWNWQHSKAVTQQLMSSALDEYDTYGAKDPMDHNDKNSDKIDEPFTIDSVLDRALIASDSVNHLNFKAHQRADVVCLIHHFGCDYVCEKMPQVPRGTLWNWRHNKNILALVEQLNIKLNTHSKKLKGDSVIEETVNKTDLTQKWLKDLQDTTLGRKRKADEDADTKAKVRKNSQGFECPNIPGSSKGSLKPKHKMGPKCSKRNERSLSPSTLCSEISVHSNDFEEIGSEEELESKKSTGSSKVGNHLKDSSPSKSDAPDDFDAQNVKFEIVKTEMEVSNRMMICYKHSNVTGHKRPSLGEADPLPPPAKKRTKSNDMCNFTDNWIPLDEYFYGTHEGDVTYTEEKGEYRFKCWYCSKMLYNNVRAMQHIQGHIDASKQQNIDLSDLTQCKHCYKQFDTPFDMQTHVEKVHLSNKVLMCRICEKDFASQKDLMLHMKGNHRICEMPYVCQLCNFRSSMYSDVVDHFKKKHDSSHYLLCLYCLRSFEVKFVSQGWGQTQTYYGHLLKHQTKSSTKKCAVCRLTFFNSIDVKNHRKNCHDSNPMNMQALTHGGKSDVGMQQKKGSTLKSLNAPSISRIQDYGEIVFPAETNNVKCVECKMIMSSTDHYKKYIHCTMCRFATSCSVAYANHMMGFHSGQMSSLNLNIPWERPMKDVVYCDCKFSSKYGNKIANHLVQCGKWTCYSTKPVSGCVMPTIAKPLQDDKKQEESLLDMLGLVQKKSVVPKIIDSLKKESTTDSQKDQSCDEKNKDKVIEPNKINVVEILEDVLETEATPVDNTQVSMENPSKDSVHNDDNTGEVTETAESVHASESVRKLTDEDENKSEDKEAFADDDECSMSEKDNTNKDTTEGKSHDEVLMIDLTSKDTKDESEKVFYVSDDEEKDSGSKVDISDGKLVDVAKETSEEIPDDDKEVIEEKMDVEKATPEEIAEDREADTANTADTELKVDDVVSTDITEDIKVDADDVKNEMDLDTEEDKKDRVEDSSLGKGDAEDQSTGDSDKNIVEETSDKNDDSKNADAGEQPAKDVLEESSKEDKKGEASGDKDCDQGDKRGTSNHGNQRESSRDRRESSRESSEHSDHHDSRSHDHRRDNRSQGSSHRSDFGSRSYNQNQDRDRSYDRDRDRDRDRDYNRHRDYNRNSGYSHHDNRDRGYRGHQGQHGGYHSNRDHQNRNRGGHHQDRGHNRNHQSRGGYNPNYRDGYRGGYY